MGEIWREFRLLGSAKNGRNSVDLFAFQRNGINEFVLWAIFSGVEIDEIFLLIDSEDGVDFVFSASDLFFFFVLKIKQIYVTKSTFFGREKKLRFAWIFFEEDEIIGDIHPRFVRI